MNRKTGGIREHPQLCQDGFSAACSINLGCFHIPHPPFTFPPIQLCQLGGSRGGEQPPMTQMSWPSAAGGGPAMANAAAARGSLQPNMPKHILQLLGPLGSCWSSQEIHGCFARQRSCSAPQHPLAPGAFRGACHSQETPLAWSLSLGSVLSPSRAPQEYTAFAPLLPES